MGYRSAAAPCQARRRARAPGSALPAALVRSRESGYDAAGQRRPDRGEEGGMKSRSEETAVSQSRKYKVRIRTSNAEYEGLFFSPYPERRLSEVLTKMEQFLNLKDARDVVTGETFPFMVISKHSIETIKVVEEWS
jgi:hypothetical protein